MPKFARFLKASKKHASFGVLFALLVLVVLLGEAVPGMGPSTTTDEADSSTEHVAGEQVVAEEGVVPQLLHIPKLDLTARFGTQLGLRASGEVEVPSIFAQVGWYKHSPVPGVLGPSVILGHVDSREGPAVFYSLGQLEIGDQIVIERSDGQVVTFVVTMSERYDQAEFPTELVYGDLDHAGLRLVTCSGWYDKEADRYSHNRVVFAKLVQD